jgi:S1-C subfamily serine protease
MKRNQVIIVVVLAFFVGTLGNIFFNRIIFPNLSTVPGFAWVGKLQSSAPIVISRREEVRLNEGVNLIELTKQAQTVTVSIYQPANRSFLGNGVIISSDGVIFTTRDVVGSNQQVMIQANDGAVYPGQVRALDPKSPLAVVTVSARNLPVAQFSDAGNMQTAQRIFALGRTNQEFTREFASGMIMKTLANNLDAQRVLSSEAFENTIRIDATLSADFIGGPVVNLQGLVIGLVVGASGQILPAEAVDGAIRTYLESGKISRPYIGLKYVMISENDAKLRGLPRGAAQVTEAAAGSPAARAGLLANDLILEVNGQQVQDSSLEQRLVAQASNEMRLKVARGAQELDLTLRPEMR